MCGEACPCPVPAVEGSEHVSVRGMGSSLFADTVGSQVYCR